MLIATLTWIYADEICGGSYAEKENNQAKLVWRYL